MKDTEKLSNYLAVVIKWEAKVLFYWNIPNGNQQFYFSQRGKLQ